MLYKRDPFGDAKVWGVLLCGVLALVAVLYFLGCGPGESAARQAARSAAYVIQSLCATQATVQECADTLIERAAYLDAPDGGPE